MALVGLPAAADRQADDEPRHGRGLGSQGLFTAIIVALVVVRVQKLFADWNIVIRMPASVPPVVYQSFLSLTPLRSSSSRSG